MEYIKYRLKNIDEAFGFREFHKQLERFMGSNNFQRHEINEIIRLLNHFYKYGPAMTEGDLYQSDYFKTKIPSPLPEEIKIDETNIG